MTVVCSFRTVQDSELIFADNFKTSLRIIIGMNSGRWKSSSSKQTNRIKEYKCVHRGKIGNPIHDCKPTVAH